jgi:hypothetical protein
LINFVSLLQEQVVDPAGAAAPADAPGRWRIDHRVTLDVHDPTWREHALQLRQDFRDEAARIRRVDEDDVEATGSGIVEKV